MPCLAQESARFGRFVVAVGDERDPVPAGQPEGQVQRPDPVAGRRRIGQLRSDDDDVQRPRHA